MSDTAMEKKLAEHGFSDKEIARLKEISIRDSENYLSLLHDLRKRFYAGVFMSIAMIVIWCGAVIVNASEHLIGISVAAIVVVGAVYFITPMRLASKAFFFLGRNKN
ncbi:hypothetical protein [Brenneria corticis]|uniref:Uncharacterized protein n=1 Tax=Brenneria corticis TaxID=2173106 RepID=A0A2U1TLH4_9GAMM|nr:hypothetical protein [Brenneria sp. CFCC 11842]PWC10280.1 hypothetical protein DDT56_22335 [Brenneria sp. CFCC 11842]